MAMPRNGWTRRELAATLAAVGAARMLPAATVSKAAAKTPAKLSSRQKDALKKAIADTQAMLTRIRATEVPDDIAPAFIIPMPEKRS